MTIDNAFQPHGQRDVQYQFGDGRWSPELYADPVLGTTIQQPDMGFWGVTFRDKQVLAQDAAPGNVLTWLMNNTVARVLPGEQRYVTTGASMRMHEAAEGKSLSGWDWLTHKIGPVQDVGDIDVRLEFSDAAFDSKQFALDWAQRDENAATRATVLQATGKDLLPMLMEARNMEHAVYLQRYHLKQAQAMQRMREFERDAGFALRWTSKLASGASNYLLTDPTFAPSMFIPFGGVQLGTARFGVRAARVIREGGRRVATALVWKNAALAGRVLNTSRKVGVGVKTVGNVPAAMHRGLATLISHRGAVATEMAILGGLHAHVHQAERVAHSEVLTDVEAYQDTYSWNETGLGVAIGAGVGYIFGGRAGHSIGRRDAIREAVTETAGGGAASPIRLSFDNVGAQGMLDNLAVRAKRAAERLVGDDYDSVAPYVLDDDLLTEVGLSTVHMTRVLEELADAADGMLNANAVHRVLADEISAAAKARRGIAATNDALGNLFEKEARASALARAVKEKPKAPEAAVLARADELMEEELEAALKRHTLRQARAVARQSSRTPVDFWKQEAADLIETAKRRDLLRHEMEYLARVERRLIEAGEDAVVEPLVRARMTRYADGTAVAPFARSKASKVGRTLRRIRDEQRLIDELPKGKERTNAMARLRAAKKRLAKVADEQGEVITPQEQRKMAEALHEAALKNPQSKDEIHKILAEIFDAVDANAATLWEDARETHRLLKAIGLGGVMRKLARSGTGMEQTLRSALAPLRLLAQEFDHAKLLVDDLDPTKALTHPTVQQTLEQVHGIVSEFADLMRRFDQAGRFGNYMRNPREYNRKLSDFNRAVIRHISRKKESTDDAVREAAALWRKHSEFIRREAAAAGIKLDVEDFFPRRWNATAIEKDRAGFRTALAAHFRRYWEEGDEVHLGTIEAMGLARRVTEDGRHLGFEVVIDGVAKRVRTLKRADLEKLGTTEDDYLKGLRTKGADGFDPMENAANRAMENLTGEAFEEAPDGRLIRTHGARGPQSEQSRKLEETVWRDAALEPYLDWRFLENVDSYMRTTGMRVLNQARHQKRWGIRGITHMDTIDYVEARLRKALTKTAATHEEVEAFRAGIRNLRQKLHLAEGRLPSMRETVEGWRDWLGDLWVNTAGALYGQGIGSTILSTEILQSTLGRTYGVTDVLRRVKQTARAFRAAAGRPDEEMRAMMTTLGLTQRHMRLHAISRFLGQQTYNHSFQFSSKMKFLEPWMDVFRSLAGQNNTYGVARRIAQLPVTVSRAVMSNMMQVGGLDFFSVWARAMHIQTMLDESGRFFRAAEKMGELLSDPAILRKLDDVEQAAVDKAIAAGRNARDAANLGQRARFKAWKGVARQAGFRNWTGAAHWQVAEKWNRHGLLKPEILAAIRESGAVIDNGTFKTFDFEKLRSYVAANPEADAVMGDALKRMKALMDETLRKRVSEQSLVQTPTSTFARTPLGKVANSMTTWTRSFHDNNVMDTLQMPMRVGASMMAAYLFGETVNMVMRDLWKGKDIEDVIDEIEQDPDNFVAKAVTSMPWLGQFGGWTRPAADALTKNDRMFRVDLGESAAEGAAAQVADLFFDTLHAATSEEDVSGRTWRTMSRWLPAYRTWHGLAANGLFEAGTGVNVINELSVDRPTRTGLEVDADAADLQILDFPTTMKPDLPEDVSFLYPEQ